MRPKNYDPLIDGAISHRALISVMEDLKHERVFTMNSHELQLRKVSYSTQLNSALIGIGLIDKYSKRLLVSDFNIGEVIKKVKLYAKERKGSRPRINHQSDFSQSHISYIDRLEKSETNRKKTEVSDLSDKELVDELRKRGFEVKAIKMIEL
jgi:hypothetical protein